MNHYLFIMFPTVLVDAAYFDQGSPVGDLFEAYVASVK
jgi:hypothetical protein